MSRRLFFRDIVSLALLSLAPAWTAHGQSESDEFLDAALAQVKQAVLPQRDDSHLAYLASLRQLRDPSLQPLFERVVNVESWPMQVHAALALAELSRDRTFDVELFSRVAPETQESIIATGLDLELINTDQLSEVLKSENLVPMARLFALAELVFVNHDADREQLAILAKSEDPHIAGLASALLHELGDSKPFDDFQSSFQDFTTPQALEQATWLFESFRRYHLTSTAPWLKSLLAKPDLNADLRSRIILCLLGIDPSVGVAAWRKDLGENAGYQSRVRAGLMLLANAQSVPAEAYDALRGEESEPLIDHIIVAGKAASTKQSEVQPLCELLSLGHARTSEWAMSHLKDIPADDAARVFEFILDRALDPQMLHNDSPAMAIEAATKLFESNPDSLLTYVQKAEDDGAAQQAIMLGLLDASDRSRGHFGKAVEAASKIRRIGSGKADSLVLLFLAKHSTALSDADKQQLGRLAAGGGRLSDALQIQAAWLYLKHTNKIDAALEQIFQRHD